MWGIEKFMNTYYPQLPNDLQSKIMMLVSDFHIPKPLFKRGQCVRYCERRRQELTQYRQTVRGRRSLGDLPTYKLLIDEDPRWDPSSKTYVYNYQYGYCGTSEGAALQTDLVLF